MVIDYTAVGQNVLFGIAALLGIAVLRNRILRCRELNSKRYLRDQQRCRARSALPVVDSPEPVEPQDVDADYVAFQLEIAQRKRRLKQADEAKKQTELFLLATVKKLRQLAATLSLTEEQQQDFDYHMQSFNADSYALHMPAQSLAAITAACQAIGVSLETIGG